MVDGTLTIEQLTCHTPTPAPQRQVLVVDDDDDARRATSAVVRSLGYPCRTARSGEAALLELGRHPAEIVLSDWSMPGMSGLELCAALKRREPRPCVILVTGFHDSARLLDGVRGGAPTISCASRSTSTSWRRACSRRAGSSAPWKR